MSDWLKEINQKYSDGVAHAFIVHGNISDYVVAPSRLGAYLSKAHEKSVFIEYSIAGGLQFRTAAERKRVMDLIESSGQASEEDAMMASIQATLGMSVPVESKRDDGESAIQMAPGQAIDVIYQIATASEDGAPLSPVILIHAGDMLVPPASKATLQPADRIILAKLSGWGNDQRLINAGPLIMLTTRILTEIHPDLLTSSSKWEAVRIDMPDTARRTALIERVLARFAADGEGVRLDAGVTVAQIANMTAALSLVHVEDVLLAAKRSGVLTLDLVSTRKREIMKSEFAGMLETHDFLPDFSDYGDDDEDGERGILYYANKWIVQPLQSGDAELCASGFLLTGPSGTGKTHLAMCIAGQAKVGFAVLKIEGITSKWQGEGAQNFGKTLEGTLAMAPCILLIDEIDQLFRRGGDNASQQDTVMFQMLMTFLADPRVKGKVVVIGATNRPDTLDSALKRSGRFTKKMPILPAGPRGRQRVIKIKCDRYLKRYLAAPLKIEDIGDDLVAATDGWTNAEIDEAAQAALEAMRDGDTDNPLEAIHLGIGMVVPTTKEIEFMTNLAIADCNDPRLLPKRYRPRAKDRAALEKKIVEQAPVERTSRRRSLD